MAATERAWPDRVRATGSDPDQHTVLFPQVIDDTKGHTLAAANTLMKDFKEMDNTANCVSVQSAPGSLTAGVQPPRAGLRAPQQQ